MAELLLYDDWIDFHLIGVNSSFNTSIQFIFHLNSTFDTRFERIHDLDILLSIVKSPVKNIHASGVCVVSKSPDIANARIEFENGCVANLTTSRISMKAMRKSRFFQKDAYISVDFLEKKAEVIRMKPAPENPSDFDMIIENAEGEKNQIIFEYPNIQPNNAILDELESFATAILENKPIEVSLQDGTEALKVALEIMEMIKN